MIEERFVIKNRMGLQVRSAGMLANKIQNYRCKIVLKFNNAEYNAKSILGLMCAGVRYGQEVLFIFDGEDEAEALNAVKNVLDAAWRETGYV